MHPEAPHNEKANSHLDHGKSNMKGCQCILGMIYLIIGISKLSMLMEGGGGHGAERNV